MKRRAMRLQRRYDTTIDRAGLALGAGSLLVGALLSLMLLLGGRHDPLSLALGWLIGSVFAAVAMTAVGGPLWLILHVAGLRQARHAAMVGAVTAMGIFVGAQTYGFGLFEMPPMDNGVWLFRWLSALATSAVVAACAAAIAAVMWRIAYRPQD